MSDSASEINATRNLPPIRWTYRHTLPVRLSHWLNVVCLFILLTSARYRASLSTTGSGLWKDGD